MTKYAAFLRGINVGGRIVKMADLRACLEGIGLRSIKTFLQSGNIVFESELDGEHLKPRIEAAFTETFGYPAKVQVIDFDSLRNIADAYPFGVAGQSQHDYIIFIENDLEKQLAGEPYELVPGEQVRAGKGVVYWRVDKGSTLKSSFAKMLTKAKYRQYNTNRNLRTITNILNSS
jgi:uncharacterized protein (DUF1697 family)